MSSGTSGVSIRVNNTHNKIGRAHIQRPAAMEDIMNTNTNAHTAVSIPVFHDFIVEDYDVCWDGRGCASTLLRDAAGNDVFRFGLNRFSGNPAFYQKLAREYSEEYDEYQRILQGYTSFYILGGGGHGWVHYTYLYIPSHQIPQTLVAWYEKDFEGVTHMYTRVARSGGAPEIWRVDNPLYIENNYVYVRKGAFLQRGACFGKIVAETNVYRLRS